MDTKVVRRRKRSRSLTNDNHQYEILRMRQPDRPVHQHRDSLFSSSSGFQNFRGFFNLAIILLVLATARVALENLIKYGILIDYWTIVETFFGKTSIWPNIASVLLVHFFVYFSFLIEKKLSKNEIKSSQAFYLIMINLSALLLWPIVAVFTIQIHVVSASFSSLLYSITFLKLYSYHHVNSWCQSDKKKTPQRRKSGDFQDIFSNNNDDHKLLQTDQQSTGNIQANLVQYPNNLSLKDIYYFIYTPTLCYELNFPRSERIRKRFLIKRLFEVIFLTQLNLALIQQWMVPTIQNSLKPLHEMDYFKMLERLLKLAIPNHIIWLISFYFYFHSFLNLIGEILRFGDREFYKDWWNAESIDYFWKNWNIPVHRWCVRHLYVPSIRKGYSKRKALLIVFVVSAIFHEYLVSVPLKMFGYWAFMGMVLQVPFAIIVPLLLNGSMANAFVWISLIIGQPLCLLACYHEYYVIHHAVY